VCGGFVQTSPQSALANLSGTQGALPNLPANWNVAPTQNALAVRRKPETGTRHLDALRWGLVPRWAPDLKGGARLILARGETVAQKPAFRDAFTKRRAVVPIDAFYEWRTDGRAKQPYAVAVADATPMALAGLWERWRGSDGTIVRSFAIIATPANTKLAAIHERMPVALPRDAWPVWLGESEGDAMALLRAIPGACVAAWPVAARVGNVRNNDAALLARDPAASVMAGLHDAPLFAGIVTQD
jgi:putative SOS response-associated peptidase YedK